MSTLNKASDVAAEIAARLAKITVVNGFNTDIGLKIMRGRRRIDDGHVPCVIVAEGLDKVTDGPGRFSNAEIVQDYLLIAYHSCHPDHPNDMAHLVIRDLKRAIFLDGGTLGNKVHKVSYKGRDIGPRGDGVAIVCASIEISVKFVEDLANP